MCRFLDKVLVALIPYLFFVVFLIFQGRKTNLFIIIVLTWSASLSLIVKNVAHSSQIYIIASKIIVKCKSIVFPCPFSVLVSLVCVVT